jgi:hypothetical protein
MFHFGISASKGGMPNVRPIFSRPYLDIFIHEGRMQKPANR